MKLGNLVADGRPFYVSLEQLKYHMEFKAPTRMGKSFAMVYLAKEIIERGKRVTFLDASLNGDSAYRLLGFVQKLNKELAKKGKDKIKVLFIDLNHKINPVFNLFHANKDESIVLLDDAFRSTFSVADAASQANISRYLPAVLRLLWQAGLSMAETKFFTDKCYEPERHAIFELAQMAEAKFGYPDDDRRMLQTAFADPRMYERFNSTATRFSQFQHDILRTMFAGETTVNLQDVQVTIMNGNAKNLTQLQKRMDGTMFVNEALYRTKGEHFFFIDEAASNATFQVADVLNYWGKSDLIFGLAYQHENQFDHKAILGAVKTNCHIKFTFTDKQEAEVKLFGMDPVKLRVADLADIKGDADLARSENPDFYKTQDFVKDQIRGKFYDLRKLTTPFVPRKTTRTLRERKVPNSPPTDSDPKPTKTVFSD